jgi:pimeloyl-ACP methyl ester carboxylesterase
LAGQVAYPSRVPPEELAAFIRAGALATVVAPLLRTLTHQQVRPLPAVRDYPVRLVWGDRDRVLPFAGFGTAMLARIPGAELIRLAGVGHVPMSDDPARVAELILDVTTAADNGAVPAGRADRDA